MKKGLIVVLIGLLFVLTACDNATETDPDKNKDECTSIETLVDGACVIVDPVCETGEVLESHVCVIPDPICEEDQVLVDGTCKYDQSLCPNNIKSNSLTNLNYYGIDNTLIQQTNDTVQMTGDLIAIYEEVKGFIYGDLYYGVDPNLVLQTEFSIYTDIETSNYLTDLEHRFYPEDTLDVLPYETTNYGYGSDYFQVSLVFDIMDKVFSQGAAYIEGTTVEVMHSSYWTVPSDDLPYDVTLYVEDNYINVKLEYLYTDPAVSFEIEEYYRFYADENDFIFDSLVINTGYLRKSFDYSITEFGVKTNEFTHYNNFVFGEAREGYVIGSMDYIEKEYTETSYIKSGRYDRAISAFTSSYDNGYWVSIFEGLGESSKYITLLEGNMPVISHRERYVDDVINPLNTFFRYNAKYLDGWDYYYDREMYIDDTEIAFDNGVGPIQLWSWGLADEYYLSVQNNYDMAGDIGNQFTNLGNGLTFNEINYDYFVLISNELIGALEAKNYISDDLIVLNGLEYSYSCNEDVFGDPYVPEEYWDIYVSVFEE